MPEGRPAIPAEVQRAVLVEAGHRCAIPTCRAIPIDLAHITPWEKVREHTFENLIALCPTCHRRYDTGQMDRKAMRQYKANLAVLNGRYCDYERRILEAYLEDREGFNPFILHATAMLHVRNLIKDGLISETMKATPTTLLDVHELHKYSAYEMFHYFEITDAGIEFAERWERADTLT